MRSVNIFTSLMSLLPGKAAMRSKAQKLDSPAKPSGAAQDLVHTDAEQREFAPGQTTDVAESMCFLPSPDSPSPNEKPRMTGNTVNGSLDNLDIPYIDEEEDVTAT